MESFRTWKEPNEAGPGCVHCDTEEDISMCSICGGNVCEEHLGDHANLECWDPEYEPPRDERAKNQCPGCGKRVRRTWCDDCYLEHADPIDWDADEWG